MPAGLYCLLGLLIFAGLCQLTLSRDRVSLLCHGIVPACFVAGSCKLALSRDPASDLLCCANVLRPSASSLTSLRRASHWQDLAGLVWGKARLLGFCAGWGDFYRLKVLLASTGYARAAITFIVTTLLPLPGLDFAHRAPPSTQRGWMHAEWAISVYPLLRAHLACTHQQPMTNSEWRSRPTQPLLPSAASNKLGKAKQATTKRSWLQPQQRRVTAS